MTAESNILLKDVSCLNTFMDNLSDCTPMCVFQMNVQRVSNIAKFHDIVTLIVSMSVKPDIVILTETWIIKGTEGLYNIPGYFSYHSCRTTSSAGVALYYKSDLQCDLLAATNDEVSYIHVNLSNPSQPGYNLALTAVYMPDSAHFSLLNSRMNELLSNDPCNHLLMGDFNTNVLQVSSNATTYLDTIERYGYSIRNTFPTRPSSGTLIDHIISNFEETACVTLENELSDHNATMILFDCQLVTHPIRGYMTISRVRTDFNGVMDDMERLNVSGGDAKVSFTHFHESLTESIGRNSNTTILKIKKNNPYASSWVNDSLIKLSKRKHRLLSKRNAGVLSVDLASRIDEVTSQVALLKSQLRDNDSKARYGRDVSAKTKWRNLNELLGRKKATDVISEIIDTEGGSVTDPSSIADAFNNHFANLPIHNTSPNELLSEFDAVPTTMFMLPTTTEEVFSVMKSLKRKKSVGYDGISTSLITHCAPVLSVLVSDLFNKCVLEGYYPDELKKARVVPVYKKGEHKTLSNYRPISILPVLNKIFEKLLYVRLSKHLDRLNFLFRRQYGFRSHSNTSCCVIDFLHQVYKNMNEAKAVTAVFLDLSKAFDMVHHDLLLKRLEACGVRGVALNLFKSYLTNRTQFVTVNGASSCLLNVNRGIPQGSVLGPLLFLIFVNSISELTLNADLFLYADDTTLLYSSPSFDLNRNLAEEDLVIINNFFNNNGLELNIGKTEAMDFKTNWSTTGDAVVRPITLEGKNIHVVSSFRYLGLMLDSHLTWEKHIQTISVRMKQTVAVMFKARDLLPRDVRRLLYFSMVHCHLNYMIEIWGSAAVTHLKRVQVIQNAALRNILQLPYLTHREQLFEDPRLKVLPVKGIYEHSLAIFVFKKTRGLVLSGITFGTAEHNYGSRFRSLIRTPRCRLTMCQNCVSVAGSTVFNGLPSSLKSIHDVMRFRRESFVHFRSRVAAYLQY